MNSNIQQIKKKTLLILKRAGVKRASIFGSYVRGKQRKDSDIDMLVDLPKSKTLFDVAELKVQLEEALNKKVDLGEYSSLKSRIKDQVLSEQVQIL